MNKLTNEQIGSFAANLTSIEEIAAILGRTYDDLNEEIKENKTNLAKAINKKKFETRQNIRSNIINSFQDKEKMSKSSFRDMIALLVYLDNLEGYNKNVEIPKQTVEVTLL